MALTEFVFKVKSDKNAVCEFTARTKGARILINLLRADTDSEINEAIYVVMAPREAYSPLLKDSFQAEFGDKMKVITKQADYASFKVPLRFGYTTENVNPIGLIMKVLGRDCFFEPIVVEDGYIHISVISPNSEGMQKFMEYSRTVRDHVVGSDAEAAARGHEAASSRGKAATEAGSAETSTGRPAHAPAAGPPRGGTDFKLVHVGPYNPIVRVEKKDESLTARQDELMKMAIALGYYSEPRRLTIEEIAEVFGISKAAAHKRLTAAENKIILDYYQGSEK